MIKNKTIEIRVCDICGKEENLEKDIAVRDCSICQKQVCEFDAYQIVDRNGIAVDRKAWGGKAWVCKNHIHLREERGNAA